MLGFRKQKITEPKEWTLKIPIYIGVTGHRDIREEDKPKLSSLVREELEKLREACPHSNFVMLNSLASGADILCAKVALNMGIGLECPLPMPVESYRWDFEQNDLDDFAELLSRADESYVVKAYSKIMHAEPDRDDCYRSAGQYIAEKSFVLIALWDGEPAKKYSCGTAMAVEHAMRGIHREDRTGLKDWWNWSVIHISCPRRTGPDIEIKTKLIEERAGAQSGLLEYIDKINALATTDDVVAVLSTSDDRKIVEYLLNRIEDANMLRRALPGVFTRELIERIAQLDGKPEIDVVYENPELIIPGLQRQGNRCCDELLLEIYKRKYGHRFNHRPQGAKSKSEIDEQLRAKDPDKAFEGLQYEDIEQFIIDDDDTSLDEFEYINADGDNRYYSRLCGQYEEWRRSKLREEKLI